MGYDAIVVGGGHNGLVAGFYLARAGLRTVILERRDIVGGACVTEEFAPGFRASTGAYVLSMLRESDLARHAAGRSAGIHVDPAGPTLNVFPDGAHYTVGDDLAPTLEETRRFSRRDAHALAAVRRATSDGDRRCRDPVLRHDGARPAHAERARSAASWRALGGSRSDTGRDLLDCAFLFTTSAKQYLAEHFESEHVMAGARLARDQRQRRRPVDAGDRVRAAARSRERADRRRTARVGVRARRHGPASREMMADAAREAGAEIRTGAEVERILTTNGRATGVALANGEEIARASRAVERRPEAHVPAVGRRGRPSGSRSCRRSAPTAAWGRA